MAPNSADQSTTVLRSYFAAGGVYLGRFHRKARIPQKTYPPPTSDYLTRQNVSDMVKSRKRSRDKFVIAFLAQTGQRIGILTAMKRDMMTKKVVRGHGIVRVPETFPNRRGRNVNKLRREYTFIVGRDTMKLLDDLPPCRGGWLLDVSLRQTGRIVDEAAQAIGIQKKGPTKIGESWSAVHPNTLREYWRERMREATADLYAVLHMWGSKVQSIYGVYELSDDELLKAYEQAEAKLSLEGDPEAAAP
jgi:integrase